MLRTCSFLNLWMNPRVLAPRLVPEPPLHLHSTFVISRGNITARLSWQHPATEAPITGYRVQWGEMLLDFGVGDSDSNLNPILDGNTAYYKVLSQVSLVLCCVLF